MSLPDYVTKALDEYARWRADRTRAVLEAAIERYAQERAFAAASGGNNQYAYAGYLDGPQRKLIEENPDTLPPFIDNPPPIG